jgi:hypothetical protein
MSHKNLAIGNAVILLSILALMSFLTIYSPLQYINPIAALTALTVAVIGIAWFKKTSNYLAFF